MSRINAASGSSLDAAACGTYQFLLFSLLLGMVGSRRWLTLQFLKTLFYFRKTGVQFQCLLVSDDCLFRLVVERVGIAQPGFGFRVARLGSGAFFQNRYG